jgi:hypothetical protein
MYPHPHRLNFPLAEEFTPIDEFIDRDGPLLGASDSVMILSF